MRRSRHERLHKRELLHELLREQIALRHMPTDDEFLPAWEQRAKHHMVQYNIHGDYTGNAWGADMSGIYIPGMEMPTEVCFVNVMLCNDGRVFVYKNGEWEKIGNAIPVPDHGELIERDALISEKAMTKYDWSDAVDVDDIKAAPTIIPADHADKESGE